MSKTINIGGDTFEVLDITDVSSYPRFVIRIGDNLYAVAASYFDASGNILTEKKTFDRINIYHPWIINKVTYTGFKTKSGKRITIASYQASDGRLSLPPDSSNYMKQNYPDTFDKMTELPREIANADWSNVVNADGFFDDCSSLENITGMYGFKGASISFRHCNAKHIPIINGENLTFFSCQGSPNIEEIHFINFTEPKENIMYQLPFDYCRGIKKLLGFNFRNQNMSAGDALYDFASNTTLRELTIDCTNVDAFGKTPCINVKELGLDSAGGWKFTLINVPTKFKGNEKDLIDVTGRSSDGTTTNTYHIVNFLDEVVIEAIELTDDRYKMQDLYPARYQTMTEVPDKLDTSKLTTVNGMFDGCSKLTKLPTFNDLSNVKTFDNFFYGLTYNLKMGELPKQFFNNKATSYANAFANVHHTTDTYTSLDLKGVTNIEGWELFCPKPENIHAFDAFEIKLPDVENVARAFNSMWLQDASKIQIGSKATIFDGICDSNRLMTKTPTFTSFTPVSAVRAFGYTGSLKSFPYDINFSKLNAPLETKKDTEYGKTNTYGSYTGEFISGSSMIKHLLDEDISPIKDMFSGSGVKNINFINVDDNSKYRRHINTHTIFDSDMNPSSFSISINGTPITNNIVLKNDTPSLIFDYGIALDGFNTYLPKIAGVIGSDTTDITIGGVVDNANAMFAFQTALKTIDFSNIPSHDFTFIDNTGTSETKSTTNFISKGNARYMFYNCGTNSNITDGLEIIGNFEIWVKSDGSYRGSGEGVDCTGMFASSSASYLKALPLQHWSWIKHADYMFANRTVKDASSLHEFIGQLSVGCPATMDYMFYKCKTDSDDFSSIAGIDCSNLEKIPEGMFDDSNIKDFELFNIPSKFDLNDFKNCRNDGQIMNLKVAHDTSTFTTIF